MQRRDYRANIEGYTGVLLEDENRGSVAGRLKRIREIIGHDQKTFAEKAGLLPQTYGPFETGKRDLTLAAAKRLRVAYGISLDYMFFGDTGGLPHRIASFL